MVPVRVLGVALDGGMQPVVLLTPLAAEGVSRTVVPIWIGPQEAASIQLALRGEDAPRPLTHDLMHSLLQATSTALDRVAITRLVDGTFFAELTLGTADGPLVLDCRPSDALALALRAGATVFMAEAVLTEAGVEDEGDDDPADLRGADGDAGSDEEVEAFRRFLDGVAPDDFQG